MSDRAIIIYTYHDKREPLSIHDLSRLSGIHPALIRELFRQGLIDPQQMTPGLLFDDTVIDRIEKIMRLKNDLGVNFAGCGLVLDLLEKIDDLEKKLQYFEMRYNR